MKPYHKLRCALMEKGIEHTDIAKAWKRSPCYVSKRFMAHESFTLDEAYGLLRMADIPPNKLYELFPKDGIEPNHSITIKGTIDTLRRAK